MGIVVIVRIGRGAAAVLRPGAVRQGGGRFGYAQ
jgi:hypothetical protein